jgi:hypothetical protein
MGDGDDAKAQASNEVVEVVIGEEEVVQADGEVVVPMDET